MNLKKLFALYLEKYIIQFLTRCKENICIMFIFTMADQQVKPVN